MYVIIKYIVLEDFTQKFKYKIYTLLNIIQNCEDWQLLTYYIKNQLQHGG